MAKASVKLVIFLPVHAGFATPGFIPVLTGDSEAEESQGMRAFAFAFSLS